MRIAVSHVRRLIKETYQSLAVNKISQEQQVLRDFITDNAEDLYKRVQIFTPAPPSTYEWYLQVVKLSFQPGIVGNLAKQAWQTLEDGPLMLFTLCSDAFSVSRPKVMRVLCAVAREALHKYLTLPGVERTLRMLEAWSEGNVSTLQVHQSLDSLNEEAALQEDVQLGTLMTQASNLLTYMTRVISATIPSVAVSNVLGIVKHSGNWTFHRPLDKDEVARLTLQYIPAPSHAVQVK